MNWLRYYSNSFGKNSSGKRSVDVVVTGKYKNNFNAVQLEEDSIKISGPRTLVNEVQKLQATLDVDENKDTYTTTLNLVPVNDRGQKVDGVTLVNFFSKCNSIIISRKKCANKSCICRR